MSSVIKNRARKVFTIPCWALLVVVTRGRLAAHIALGTDFSSQVWSSSWVARYCPKRRLSLGGRRWRTIGKKPNILEKLWAGRVGVGENCLLVSCVSSRAKRRPRSVTRRAITFRRGGMVIICVLGIIILEVIRRPAMILPQARRLMGFTTFGSFSLIGEKAENRGCPMVTKKITRRL